MITFLAYWCLASCIGGIAFCWLLKTKRISLEVVEDDPNEFVHDWLERRV